MLKQRTLKSQIKTTGVGLHTGVRVDLTLRPAQPDTGIVFHRVDLPDAAAIPADARNVGDTRLSSSLEKDGAKVSTVEHLMSALAGLGIDNLHVDIAGPELPILDGSAGPFVFLLQSAGIAEQNAPKRYLRIKSTVEVVHGDKVARFEPYDGFLLDFTIDFPHPVFGSENRHVIIDFAEHSYTKEVSRARTSDSCRTSKRCGPPDWHWAAACRTPSCSTNANTQQRRPALRQRIRQAQGARCDRRSVLARPSADWQVHGVQVGTRAQQRGVACLARAYRCLGTGDFCRDDRRAQRISGLAAAASLTTCRSKSWQPPDSVRLPWPRRRRPAHRRFRCDHRPRTALLGAGHDRCGAHHVRHQARPAVPALHRKGGQVFRHSIARRFHVSCAPSRVPDALTLANRRCAPTASTHRPTASRRPPRRWRQDERRFLYLIVF